MRARTVAAPTNDHDVKMQLRKFREPICLFGEGPAERRDRLKIILARKEVEEGISANDIVSGAREDDDRDFRDGQVKETFYTEGPDELKTARLWIAEYSLPRAKSRTMIAKRKQAELETYIAKKEAKLKEYETAIKEGREIPEEDIEDTRMDEDNETEQEHNRFMDKAGKYRNLDLSSSQIGDARPISGCSFSPDGQFLATSSWSGVAKIWSMPSCDLKFTLYGHAERLTDAKFHPQFDSAAVGNTEGKGKVVAAATSSADLKVKLWSNDSFRDIGTLEGHAGRVCRIGFHPSGRYLGTTSFDKTWRMWDLETQQELLCQEGHSRALYNLAFQVDGALVASAGLDAICRVWDLRTGRSIMTLQGHVKQILGLDFNPDGVKIATGSDDNTIKLWDLRKRKAYYTMPAHPNLVSAVKYSSCGDFLISSSYDRTCKIWNLRNFTAIKTLSGHDEKVMCVDFAPAGDLVVSASYDRTFKVWSTE
ncbi:hypothetical protein GUITHDRAFT_166652, partial [Guillardia theta CCMP2712]